MQQKKYTPEKCTIKTYKSGNGKTEFLKQNPAFHKLNPQTREDKTTAELVNVHKRKLTSCVDESKKKKERKKRKKTPTPEVHRHKRRMDTHRRQHGFHSGRGTGGLKSYQGISTCQNWQIMPMFNEFPLTFPMGPAGGLLH